MNDPSEKSGSNLMLTGNMPGGLRLSDPFTAHSVGRAQGLWGGGGRSGPPQKPADYHHDLAPSPDFFFDRERLDF